MLLFIQTCDVNIWLCSSLFLPREKKTTTFFLHQIRWTGRCSGKKYSIRISLQSTTKLLPICSFVKKKTRLPEKLYVSTGVSLFFTFHLFFSPPPPDLKGWVTGFRIAVEGVENCEQKSSATCS